MLGFAISLRSKRTTTDWDRAVLLLSRTLDSVLNQTSRDVRAVVGCHEYPDALSIADDRISFEQVDYPPPIYKDEWVVDKQRKREIATLSAYRMGCTYVMPLDADDLVSNRLAEFVLGQGAEFGYIVEKGYEYSFERDCFSYAPRLSRVCGSCGVFRWQEGDLPKTPWEPGDFAYREQVNTPHPGWKRRNQEVNRPLVPIPFPAVTYVVETGQNISVLKGAVGPRRKLVRRFMPTVRNDAALRKEFGLADPQLKLNAPSPEPSIAS